MVIIDPLIELSRRVLWPPYTTLDDQQQREPLVIREAEGVWLIDNAGKRYLDANASWWSSSIGHRHPRLVSALKAQADCMPHCAMAGLIHEPAVKLAEELVRVAPKGLTRVFFSDDGSTAVETALKMAVQYWQQAGRPERTKFVTLSQAYHGDTTGAVSVGGVPVFRARYGALLFDVLYPPVSQGAWPEVFESLFKLIAQEKDQIAGVVIEPLIQGAAGMRMYSPELLGTLRECCTSADTFLIADEVFVGYGRTGKMWACDHAGVSPDILCTAKGFTGGMLPMSATLASERIYEGFSGGVDRMFVHGHTFYGNPLGAAVAREVLNIYREDNVLMQAQHNAERIRAGFQRYASHSLVRNIRSLGVCAAFELGEGGYAGKLGWQMFELARERGVYLRPLGDTVYVTPALNIAAQDLDFLLTTLHDCLCEISAS